MGSHAAMSPGAALLRSSRMFSLPKPLPDPHTVKLRSREFGSPTMTNPYPTHQSIASPPAHRELGDWGLKRPFPRKTTLATSTPLIRVKQVDSRESVTDFASSADYSISLEKFRELNVPLYVAIDQNPNFNQEKTDNRLYRSVFEEEMDFTHVPPGGDSTDVIDKRWKFEGPWVSRLNEQEFSRYLKEKVQPRRAEFHALLKDLLAQELTATRTQAAREKGNELPPPVTTTEITDEEMMEFIRKIRHDRILSYGLTSSFLDMGPLGHPATGLADILLPTRGFLTKSPYAKTGPPRSHPSAGISYLRTNAFTENHPLYGPQRKKIQVEARIVNPKYKSKRAKLGIGGFVVEAPRGVNELNSRQKPQHPDLLPGIEYLDVLSYGGAKAYVDVQMAVLDSMGKVVLQITETDRVAQLVAMEMKGIPNMIYQGPTDYQTSSQKTFQMSSLEASTTYQSTKTPVMEYKS
ncbi:hypothetical protein XA68_14581 [Ophiocordyceps unilateralis]|uniref:Uncharacterized protein n=1 Tax=Ophiocordyceps unilateralis TaxID=268505 RepID=A0A2A9PA24_OPHUN|nr:hypothetical protein XA68_14581 [Ophiocordyceps unilateralis]